jgi:uroporphyrinogen decarboxylase
MNTTAAEPNVPLTPRQRAIEALERRRPPGSVPTCELAFNLYEDWLGHPPTDLGPCQEGDASLRKKLLRQFARETAEVYRQIDHCIVTHWLGDEDLMADLIEAYRDETGEEFMLGFPADGTKGFPQDGNLEAFSYRLVDEPQKVHEESKRSIDAALAKAQRMKQAGADVVWMGSDYAMNSGPFLSPSMFAEFVTPYLREVIAGFKSLGLYVIKHSDGDLNPILDQIVEAGPHAIHSLDAIANMDIRLIKQEYGDRVALIGNVPHGPLQMKQYDAVEEAARYALTHGGVEAGGYIYSTSNAVFGGEITGITAEAYRFMLSVRDEFMKELS